MVFVFFFFFFFSSRRRHTRSLCDWSSDVCSSDLVYKEYSHATGWDTGLTLLSEFWSEGVKKKWISTAWTQDNITLSYPQNPRVSETNIYDDAGNRRRTTIDYGQGYSLPTSIVDYAGAQTLLRTTTLS